MQNYCLVDLGVANRRGYFMGATLPASDPAYSKWIDIGFNRSEQAWRDPSAHLHTDSEEYFIVLKGRIDLEVNQVPIPVMPGWMVGVRGRVPHRITGVETPIENFILRVPGGGRDKVLLYPQTSATLIDRPDGGIIRLDLHQPHDDYLLGACLPPAQETYSSHLDFTCGWDVNPLLEWRGEKLHYHRLREEYYIVLKGRLDFEINGARLSLSPWQILGVRPGTIHKVTGGKGLVDILFVRVPGGRGDKVVVEEP
jgi:mannose-6-phosphate isomerase-like protein (cupin superfamily)